MKGKRLWWAALILVVAAVLLLARSGFFASPPPDQAEAEALLSALGSGEAYRFASQCFVTTQGQQREYFLLTGERSGADSHFLGSILGTEVELYLVEDRLYQRNGDGAWRVNRVPDVSRAVTLFAELDPASAFVCRGARAFEYLGRTETDRGRLHQVALTPEQGGWVGEYFTDVDYTLWIGGRERQLVRAELTGALREDPETQLRLILEIYDLGKETVIQPPEV